MGLRLCSASPAPLSQADDLRKILLSPNPESLLTRSLAHLTLPNSGWTLLHLFAWYGNDKGVVAMCKLKGDVNVEDKGGNTPLHLAALNGHVETLRLLLAHKADPHHRNSDGKKPLDLARKELQPLMEEVFRRNFATGEDDHNRSTEHLLQLASSRTDLPMRKEHKSSSAKVRPETNSWKSSIDEE